MLCTEFQKPFYKMLISFQEKSRIIEYSLDLPLINMICKHDGHVSHIVLDVYSVIWLQDSWQNQNVYMVGNRIYDI